MALMDTVPADVLQHLKDREGFKTVVYKDSLGLPTVGLGHLLTADEKTRFPVGSTVPINVLNVWAQIDSLKAYNAALGQAEELGVNTPEFINALTSVNFQLGILWTGKFPHTWALMKQHDWLGAATAVQESQWYKQTPVRVRDFQNALMDNGNAS